jgi:hypothetical protein
MSGRDGKLPLNARCQHLNLSGITAQQVYLFGLITMYSAIAEHDEARGIYTRNLIRASHFGLTIRFQ